MRVWKVKFGTSVNMADDYWFVLASTFSEAAKKANKVAVEKDKAYTSRGRGVISVELQGKEEN